MMLFICLLLYFINLANSQCVLHSASQHSLWEKNLQEHIRCNYQHTVKNTTVKIKFKLKSFRFYEDDERFSIYSWLFLTWNDPTIKWNPDDHDGIKTTHVMPDDLWTPDLKVDYQIDSEMDLIDSYTTECLVEFDGQVICIPRITHSVQCKLKLRNWPYDVQTCRFNYTSNVKLTHGGQRGVSALGAEYGTGWDIVDYQYADPSAFLDKITITLVVERTAGGFSCMYLAPLAVIVILNIVAMILDIKKMARFYILGSCLICCYNLMLSLMSNIPVNGSSSPKVLVFLRTSMLLLTLSIVVTFVLKNIRSKRNVVPPYVSRFNEFFLKYGTRVFLWPKWEAEEIEDEDLKKIVSEWTLFSSVLNILVIMSYCILYGILIIVYMPRPLPTMDY